MKKKRNKSKKGVILVGHGGVPKDFPYELIAKLKRLEMQRSSSGLKPTPEEMELDSKIRNWPRTSETDPYKAGLESLGAQLKPLLGEAQFKVAFNEFCAPTLEEAVSQFVSSGVEEITVIPSMLTPGGSHSELEVPEIMKDLRSTYPSVKFWYAWPFDLKKVAYLLWEQVERFH
ncbi:MAG TPA: CbiX/SirB N-terminal domain-containing protein [Nitrospiria bacterium]|jgi:sirohydrochlorin cobaltochelatase